MTEKKKKDYLLPKHREKDFQTWFREDFIIISRLLLQWGIKNKQSRKKY